MKLDKKVKRWYQIDSAEVMAMFGFGLITWGCWEIYPPLAPIFSGTILAAFSVWGMIGGDS